MGKKELYFKHIQEIAINNMDNITNYLEDVGVFLKEQKILKRNIINNDEEKLKIYFIEYVRNNLKEDYERNELDIIDFLYLQVSEVCLSLKTVVTDSILTFLLINMRDVLNNIKVKDYNDKKKLIEEYELKIKQLKEGFI